MGLFDSKRVTTTNQTDLTNVSTGQEGIDGAAVGGVNNALNVATIDGDLNGPGVFGDGNSLSLTLGDYGAIRGGLEFANDVARGQRDSVAEVLGVARDVVDSGLDYGRNAFAFGRSALDFGTDVLEANAGVVQYGLDYADRMGDRSIGAVLDSARYGIDAANDSRDSGLNFAADIFQSSIAGIVDATERTQDTIAATVGGLNSIAKEQATSADGRVQKTALYALVAVAAIIVVPMLFKR